MTMPRRFTRLAFVMMAILSGHIVAAQKLAPVPAEGQPLAVNVQALKSACDDQNSDKIEVHRKIVVEAAESQ